MPLIEGTTVRTPHGNVKTDHILFIAAGAFHKTKPADLLPELQVGSSGNAMQCNAASITC